MQTRRVVLLVAASVVAFTTLGSGQTSRAKVTVSSQPLYAGRIDPKLFGNFMELLDDLVPGMWAEMLNDRSFEGVTRPANWVYADGAPNICDREWDQNGTWTHDSENAFNGSRSVKLTAARRQSASLTLSRLYENVPIGTR
jgi:hypothetical protein